MSKIVIQYGIPSSSGSDACNFSNFILSPPLPHPHQTNPCDLSSSVFLILRPSFLPSLCLVNSYLPLKTQFSWVPGWALSQRVGGDLECKLRSLRVTEEVSARAKSGKCRGFLTICLEGLVRGGFSRRRASRCEQVRREETSSGK